MLIYIASHISTLSSHHTVYACKIPLLLKGLKVPVTAQILAVVAT